MEADAGAQLTALGLPAAYLEGAAVGELGRVGEDGGSAVQVHTAAGTEWALLSGRARDAADRPVVGDWVELSRTADRPVVVRTLPRRTAVRRMSLHLDGREQALAANVDVVFVCFPARKVSAYLIESMLGVAVSSGAAAVLVVTKKDLATARDLADMQLLLAELDAVPTVWTSALAGSGMDELAGHLRPDRTGVFLGASGVGKSTITNALLGDAVSRTGRVKDSGEGRHTTTSRQLFVLPSGGVVIDTPGLRSVTPAPDPDTRGLVYPEVAEVAAGCRFSDCQHRSEPGCAINAAIAAGELSVDRVERDRRMASEARRQVRLMDKRVAADEHKNLVVLAKAAKRRRQGR